MANYADTSHYTAEEIEIWNLFCAKEGQTFFTVKGLPFTFTVKGNEVFFSRKKKSITRAAINRAYNATFLRPITGPKKLNVFGASYLYPVFMSIGLVKMPDQEREEKGRVLLTEDEPEQAGETE